MYGFLVAVHTSCALLTVSGFVLRGCWMLQKLPLLRHPVTRIAPHVIDILFLASGIALLFELDLEVLQNNWLLAKLIGLVVYISLGMVALRFGPTRQVRTIAFVGAVTVFAYIVGVALSKSPMSWLAYVTL